jgi:hypothetical protein
MGKRRGSYYGGSTIISARAECSLDRQLDAEDQDALKHRPIASTPVAGERETDEQRLKEILERQRLERQRNEQRLNNYLRRQSRQARQQKKLARTSTGRWTRMRRKHGK